MFSKKYFHYVFVAMMALSMTLVLSFLTTINHEGLSSQFLYLWLMAAGLDFGIAFPTAQVVVPIANWAAGKLTTPI